MAKIIDIIIPTFNNEEYLNPCVISIIKNGILNDMANLIIVNNGKQDIERHFGSHKDIKILNPGKNLGWEGGLEYALKYSDAPFVCFQNDDTFLPPVSSLFYQRLLIPFADRNVAAVGPSTTTAAGTQSIYHPFTPTSAIEAAYLIFFCVMIRREYLDKVGGIDTSLPGGDDFDLSIRFRKENYDLVIQPNAFIIHYGFKTGTRVKGTSEMKGGWNSIEMQERTNINLIRKHGFKLFFKTLQGLKYEGSPALSDLEGQLIRSFIDGEENIVEIGCGAKKTVEKSIGIDRVPKGEPIPYLNGALSVADIVSDVSKPLPLPEKSQDAVIARHILEHCIDSVKTIYEWRKALKVGGKLILAVPDEGITQGIPLNPEHVHAFTQESLNNLLENCGFKTLSSQSSNNGVSFVGCYERLN